MPVMRSSVVVHAPDGSKFRFQAHVWIFCFALLMCTQFATSISSTRVADINRDEIVDLFDILGVITDWGPCQTPFCPSDVTGDRTTDLFDIVEVINAWKLPNTCAITVVPSILNASLGEALVRVDVLNGTAISLRWSTGAQENPTTLSSPTEVMVVDGECSARYSFSVPLLLSETLPFGDTVASIETSMNLSGDKTCRVSIGSSAVSCDIVGTTLTMTADLGIVAVFNYSASAAVSELHLSRLCFFFAKEAAGATKRSSGARDDPGCDVIPCDSVCGLACCRTHDICLAINNCTFLSWGAPGSECWNLCHEPALKCFLEKCDSLDRQARPCFDAKCDALFTCYGYNGNGEDPGWGNKYTDSCDFCNSCSSPCCETDNECLQRGATLCMDGKCRCPKTAEGCGTDENCVACPFGTECVNGKCVCPSKVYACGTPESCNPCPINTRCVENECVCPGADFACGTVQSCELCQSNSECIDNVCSSTPSLDGAYSGTYSGDASGTWIGSVAGGIFYFDSSLGPSGRSPIANLTVSFSLNFSSFHGTFVVNAGDGRGVTCSGTWETDGNLGGHIDRGTWEGRLNGRK